ncbi:putative peptidase family-domain-containing protein [Aspergillus spinulosporus]
MTQHPIDPASSANRLRSASPGLTKQPFQITNLEDGEVVHQTCVSIHGTCPILDSTPETLHITIRVTDGLTQTQTATPWPLYNGRWKALAMLAPGSNKITLELHHLHGIYQTLSISVTYLPLLQVPPLHLAILVAKDSPLLIDCPPAKHGAFSSAHSDLDAAVAKFRMTAYMWQALTAEDLRSKGLGRRSFRLDEEWGVNTTLRTTHANAYGHANAQPALGAVARVHIIKSDKTVAELRDAQVAQQNPRGQDREALHRYFEAALASSGLPIFEAASRPVVAGLLLDSHYSPEQSLILGHAALGCHKPQGLSLGIFGSHLTYSWPRFLEEVPACLVDLRDPGATVGNDNGECQTMRSACFVGQGAFLHEVGHAFGARHTTGIMARGYSRSWGRNFIEHEGNNGLKDEAKWDLRDVLLFKLLPHFALPGDEDPLPAELKQASVSVDIVVGDEDDDDESVEVLKVFCKAGLAVVTVQSGNNEPQMYLSDVNGSRTTLYIHTTGDVFDRTKPLRIEALGKNGKERIIKDAWLLFNDRPFIPIRGSKHLLRKQSVHAGSFETRDYDDFIRWAVLLRHRGTDGNIYRATSIDLRVGALMDGAIVYYADGERENCGPARKKNSRQPHQFGGHASESHVLPVGETIQKVTICRSWGSLAGIRMTLSNGESWGHLNYRDDDGSEFGEDDYGDTDSVVVLEPGEDEVIVGFFGHSLKGSGFTYQFGILTAPKDVELPEVVYDMPELRNR